jgi:hypothetical protein
MLALLNTGLSNYHEVDTLQYFINDILSTDNSIVSIIKFAAKIIGELLTLKRTFYL